jgi:hypothetical protein
VGRALRVFPGKQQAIILDHVGAVVTHGLPDEDRDWSLDGVSRGKREANDNDPGAVDRVTTCPRCFCIHLPAGVCPSCAYEYPVRERKLETIDGQLQEIDQAAIEAMRRQKRIMQGQAQSVDELVAQGIGRFRAQKIVEARQQKQALVDGIMAQLDAIRTSTGQGPYAACGHTLMDIKRLKPKELRALNENIAKKI